MPKTILVISGGVLQDVITNDPDSEFIIVDWDNIEAGDDMGQYPKIVLTGEAFDEKINEIQEEIYKLHEKNGIGSESN